MPDEFERFDVDVEPTDDGVRVEIPEEVIRASGCDLVGGVVAAPYSSGIHLLGPPDGG